MVIENTRQIRGRADDYCPDWQNGNHSFDRSKGCRQAMKREDRGRTNFSGIGTRGRPAPPEIALCMGWGSPTTSSSLVLGRA